MISNLMNAHRPILLCLIMPAFLAVSPTCFADEVPPGKAVQKKRGLVFNIPTWDPMKLEEAILDWRKDLKEPSFPKKKRCQERMALP